MISTLATVFLCFSIITFAAGVIGAVKVVTKSLTIHRKLLSMMDERVRLLEVELAERCTPEEIEQLHKARENLEQVVRDRLKNDQNTES